MYDDSGYGREPGYPRGSRMEREYNSYKAADKAAGVATTSYKKEAAELAVPRRTPGAASGAVKTKYYYPKHHAKLAGSANHAAEATRLYVYTQPFVLSTRN